MGGELHSTRILARGCTLNRGMGRRKPEWDNPDSRENKMDWSLLCYEADDSAHHTYCRRKSQGPGQLREFTTCIVVALLNQ